MKKMMMFAASVAMALAVAGCGKSKDSSTEEAENVSASAVAEKFVNAVIKQNTKEAVSCCRLAKDGKSEDIENDLKRAGDKIGDKDLVVKAIKEVTTISRELKAGKWQTTEEAEVVAQLAKGKDKKSEGMRVNLEKVGSSWKVTNVRDVSGLDTSDNEEKEPSKAGSPIRAASKADAFSAAKDVKAPSYPRYAAKDAAKKADYGSSSKVREFENICREILAEAKKAGKTLDESEMREEIEKFRKLSSDEQEKQLREGRKMLNMLRAVKDLK